MEGLFRAFVIFFLIGLDLESRLASRVIIVEDAKACFRRALAGKRISHSLVRKSLYCERVEDCMRECAEERSFVCEGFNYRLDPLGKGQGDCELLDLPLQQLNLRRDLVHDSEFDYYERDRNSGPDCRRILSQQPSFRPYDRPTYTYRDRPYHPRDDRPRDTFDGYRYHRPRDRGYYDRRNKYYGDREPPPGYGDEGYYNYPDENSRRGGKDYSYYSHHRSHVDEYNYRNYSEDDRYDWDRAFFPPPTRAPSYLPEGAGASRKTPPSPEIIPPLPSSSTTYLPSSPTYLPSSPTYLPSIPTASEPSKPDYGLGPGPTTPSTLLYPEHRGISPPHFVYDDRRNSLLPPPPPQLYHRRPDPYLPGDDSNGRPDKTYPSRRPTHDYRPYEPYLPPDFKWNYDGHFKDRNFYWDNFFREREKDWKYWGLDGRKSYWSYGNFGKPYVYVNPLPQKPLNWNDFPNDFEDKKYYQPFTPTYKPKDWYVSAGLYGYGGLKGYHDYHKSSYNYRGLSKFDDQNFFSNLYRYHDGGSFGDTIPSKGLFYSHHDTNFLPTAQSFDYLPEDELRYFANDYSVMKACSLRMATGFRLHKHVVRKYLPVKDIYECELLCYKESSFLCSSYAYRYTQGPSVPPENCYLSEKRHKDLDYYVDLEPNRNFDVYTMNNREMCHKLFVSNPDYSDCFWRVRSGMRLDHSVVRDSLSCQTLLDCQLECLNARSFTCRAFTFRFETSTPEGIIDNCQLTDWPFLDLNPRIHLIPELGFELYERGSFGHGCESYHFKIGPHRNTTTKNMDELCYVGYGSPARILPVATKSSVRVENDLECRKKCTEAREKSLFQCMSYSFRTNIPANSPNCDLSDINQSDLLPNIDYVFDKDSLLYAWNDYDPECVKVIDSKGTYSDHDQNSITLHPNVAAYPLDTWRMFSVSGWPCKSLSKQNPEAGFWFCEIEGASPNSWDYCCRPDHQCGFSEGYSYQWCHVGNDKTQWRKCSDKYYPYARNVIIRLPERTPESYLSPKPFHTNLISGFQPSYNFGYRPDRPPAPERLPPYKSLDEYEKEFDTQFLRKSESDALGESKHWPVSYLHKEMPPSETDANNTKESTKPKGRSLDSKYEAISNLIEVIKQEELNDIKYQIGNKTDNSNEILVVEIPLPSNFTGNDTRSPAMEKDMRGTTNSKASENGKEGRNDNKTKPLYSRGYVTRTNKPYSKK